MLRFRSDIKPPRWGGRGEIEYALRVNCERLGLPMPIAWTPCWSFEYGEQFLGGGAIVPGDSANIRFDAQGVHVIGTTGASSLLVPVQEKTIAEVYAFYSGETAYSTVGFFSTYSSVNILRSVRLTANGYRLYGNGAYLASANSTVTDPATASAQTTWSAGWSAPANKNLHRYSINENNSFRTSARSSTGTTVTFPAGERIRLPQASKHRFFALWDAYPSNEVDARLHYEPYSLLMPVARPLYFDLGSPGGTPYTIYQDMLARISWDQAVVQDALSKISTLQDLTQDARAAISSAVATIQAARASVSLVYSLAQHAFTAISEDYLVLQDAQSTISEQVGYVITQDVLAQIHETYAKVQDASAGISEEIIVVQDARAVISEGVVYSVTQAAIAKISSALLVRQDAVSKVASTVREIQDAVAGVSSGYLVIQDGKAVLIEVDFETMAKIVLPSQGVTHMSLPSAGELRIALTSHNIITIVRIGG